MVMERRKERDREPVSQKRVSKDRQKDRHTNRHIHTDGQINTYTDKHKVKENLDQKGKTNVKIYV